MQRLYVCGFLCLHVWLCSHEGTANEIALAADCVTVPGEMELFIDMERRNQER